ncbi:hypothetical protein AWB80_08184 [Caballeronia pedi]|uniref:Uncharacterized protein n=1 Tax=Caballeronia pedi TaxID=1777141 RepID=A0A158E4E4_9BURK|nr:hypothetical protein [Caballeronia pedi]SAL01674.1 hypothetical protein AWB80_08184 [Caballeronia pedi]
MNTEKSWTYQQITDTAEEQIKLWIKKADEDLDLAYLYRQRALGTYELWFKMTQGWIADGDIVRLRDLMKHQFS